MITGATSGMGKATAVALAQKGATVIIVARNQNKGEMVCNEIRRQTGNPSYVCRSLITAIHSRTSSDL